MKALEHENLMYKIFGFKIIEERNMKKLEFTTSKGIFILEEASDKNLGRALIKYMTEDQFSQVVDSTKKGEVLTCFKDYTKGYYSNSLFTAKESFISLVKSLGWYLWENPYKDP